MGDHNEFEGLELNNSESDITSEGQEAYKSKAAFEYGSLEAVRKKLLDLTGRNQLINYKHPRASCVRLIDELPDQIFEQLQNGAFLNFIPVPDPSEKELITEGYLTKDPEKGLVKLKPYPSAEQWAKVHGLNTSYELPQPSEDEQADKHSDLDIQTLMYARELEAKLRSIRKKSQTAIEESGSNILYLVLGFLEWYETPESEVKRLAPLFTLPVQLERLKLDSSQGVFRYAIQLKDESMLTNVTLKEKLALDFDLDLPLIDDEITPEKYFNLIENTLLKHQPRWKLRRMASLALLNFSKQVMYADLDPNNWPEHKRIEDHPIIKRFFSSQDTGDQSVEIHGEYEIDEIDDVHTLFPLIDRADSSQHSALIDAVNGECLVIEGPPGSGKSQTITNLIAACIANGKKVLFVAEKMAALSVVKNRLDRSGLGDFCLELHSHKTNKQLLFSDLKHRLDKQNEYRDPEEINADIARYEDLKNRLNDYVRLINSDWKHTGKSIHTILQASTRLREKLQLNPVDLQISNVHGGNLTLVKRKDLLDRAEMLVNIFKQVQEQAEGSNIANHHWYGLNNAELLKQDLDDLDTVLKTWIDELIRLKQCVDALQSEFGRDKAFFEQLQAISQFRDAVVKLPPLLGNEPLSILPKLLPHTEDFKNILNRYRSICSHLDQIEPIFNDDALKDKDAPRNLHDNLRRLLKIGLPESTPLTEVEKDHELASKALSDCQEIKNQLEGIRKVIPPDLDLLFNGTVKGLEELHGFVRLTGKLPADLWGHRNAIYDSPEMDALLDQLTTEFSEALPLYEKLKEEFRLEQLPTAREVREWQDILGNSGFFSFLSGTYRKAKRNVFALSVSIKPDKKRLFNLLPSLYAYKQKLEQIESINKSSPILNPVYCGIDTPIERIKELRSWYRAVRLEYGRGLSPRAYLGDLLIALEDDMAYNLADLKNSQLLVAIQNVLNAYKSFSIKYAKYPPFSNNSAVLTDSDSPLLKLAKDLGSILAPCLKIVRKTSLTIADSMASAKKLNGVHKAIADWQKSNLVKAINPTYFQLNCYREERNANHLAMAQNFIKILESARISEALVAFLTNHPNSDAYKRIVLLNQQLNGILNNAESEWERFKSLGNINAEEWNESIQGNLEALISKNKRALENPNWRQTWLDYIRARRRLAANGVENILEKLESGEIRATDFCEVVEMILMYQLSLEILSEQPSLAEFTGLEQAAIRDKYCEYDHNLMQLQRQKIAFRAAQTQIPLGNSSGKVSTYSEASLIKHEAGKKKRQIAVRTLMQNAGEAIKSLKPCFMMSPMSVAQYLAPGNFDFDIVVMDEASQIKPEDAIGAIARGRSFVVVGDPKQLPPTSFFDKISDDEDGDGVVGAQEAESILDSVIPMFKTRRLRWHYRSRHESLIAFSNLHYYHNDLVIFPSPYKETAEFGIRYHFVKRGRFARGKNAEEARMIALAALEHLVAHPEESIGLVAMNAEQMGEIEMHLEELIKDNPLYRTAQEQNSSTEEPLFVKNLENVQGDERDVIMISMTYGPDEVGGRVFQRFGPINKDVGWRRLNVLFTRSKKRMHIFSSMRSTDVVVSVTSKRGVRSLRDFIAYCESGHLEKAEVSGRAPESDFEIAVMNELAKHGYSCVPQVGVAGYYLDLAVVDPNNGGRYLMGVECDGASYHSAKSARDRDRLRQEILESLGWRIRRIWSTDWFKNPESQLQPILNELELLTSEAGSAQDYVPTNFDFIDNKNDVVQGRSERESLAEPIKESMTYAEISETDDVSKDELSLQDVLKNFDKEVIQVQFPDTDEHHRLLRPAMLEALLHQLPTSKEEFSLNIPSYLREATDIAEARTFLQPVLEMISDYG